MVDDTRLFWRKLSIVIVLAILLGVSAYLVVDHMNKPPTQPPTQQTISAPLPDDVHKHPDRNAPMYEEPPLADSADRSFAIPDEYDKINLRWFSPLADEAIPVSLAKLSDESTQDAWVDGTSLWAPSIEPKKWYRVNPGASVWFPWVEFKVDNGVHVRDPGSSFSESFPALPVVMTVEVRLVLEPFVSEWHKDNTLPPGMASISLQGVIPKPGDLLSSPKFRDLRYRRWKQTIEYEVPAPDVEPEGHYLRVPRWRLKADKIELGGASWTALASSGDRMPVQDGIVVFKLAKVVRCRVEVRDPAPDTFRNNVLSHLEELNERKREHKLPGGRMTRDVSNTLEVGIRFVSLEDGRKLYGSSRVSGVNPDDLQGRSGIVHSFSFELTGLPTGESVGVILTVSDRRGKILGYGEAIFRNVGHEQVAVLDATRAAESPVDFVATTVTGDPVPYFQFKYELVRGASTLAGGKEICDKEGRASVGRLPRVPGARLQVRSDTYAPLVGGDDRNRVWLTQNDLEGGEPIRLRVENHPPAPLTLRFHFPDGVQPPAHMRYLIIPRPGKQRGQATFDTAAALLPGNVIVTSVNSGGGHFVLLTWDDAFFMVKLDYDPVRRAIHDVEVPTLSPVTLVSDREMYVWPMRVSGPEAWTMSNFPSYERKIVFARLRLMPDRAQVIRVADPQDLLPSTYGVLKDGTFVQVAWEAQRDDEQLKLMAKEVTSVASGGLQVEIKAADLEPLQKEIREYSADAFVVVTPVFSEGADGMNANVALGKHEKIVGTTTTVNGLPAGRYFAVVMVRSGLRPYGAVGDEWSAIVEIKDGEDTKLALPK